MTINTAPKIHAEDLQSTVKTNQKLPFPKTPTKPNLIVGMVLDKENKIIEKAIVEIQNQNGMPVRALKTNVLGQFFASTPLEDGEYIILGEKNGFQFEPQKLTINGKIIPPLEIRAS